MSLLEIKNLHANVAGREILKGIDLAINAGEVHAIMGPNGSGKSTLAQVLAGRDLYEVTAGEVAYDGKDLLAMSPEDRAREGIFLAFQYPVEIPGVSNLYFLKAALNAIRKHQGQPELDAMDFLALVKEKMALMEMDRSLLNRAVNDRLFWRRKKAQRDLSDGCAGTQAGHPGRDRFRPGYRRAEDRSQWASTRCAVPHRAMIVVTHYQRLLELHRARFCARAG